MIIIENVLQQMNYLTYILSTHFLLKTVRWQKSFLIYKDKLLKIQNYLLIIFYLNTNNGATEFKSGEGIDSIKNRLVVFPKNTYHRAVSQTDTDKRIVLNFNYISDNQ